MDIEQFRSYCLAKQFVSEDYPFDETTLVFRIVGKIFALTHSCQVPFNITLKCEPERAVELREQYPQIQPAWHWNKKHWNMMETAELDDKFLYELIDHAYDLVMSGLTKKEHETLK